jgi:hypothetical protein
MQVFSEIAKLGMNYVQLVVTMTLLRARPPATADETPPLKNLLKGADWEVTAGFSLYGGMVGKSML